MTKYLRTTIVLSIIHSLLVALGVILLPSLVLGAIWASSALVVHTIILTLVGYYELRAEFGSRQRHPTARVVIN